MMIAPLAVFVWSPGDPINGENLVRLEEGMSAADVEAILGTPETNCDDSQGGASRWVGHEYTLYAWFDADSRLIRTHMDWQTGHNQSLNWFVSWRKRLGW
jgi:hypothetical protein